MFVWVGTGQWRCDGLMKNGHFGRTKGDSLTVLPLWKHCVALQRWKAHDCRLWLISTLFPACRPRMMEVLTGDPSGSRHQRIEPRTLIDKQMGHLDSCAVCSQCHSGYFKWGFFSSCETFIFPGPDADKLLWGPLSGKLAASLHIVIWAYWGGGG